MWFACVLLIISAIKSPVDSLKSVESLFIREQYREAIKGYQSLTKFKDTAPEALYRIGECYYNLDEYEKAIDVFECILKDYKDSYLCPEAIYSLGMCWLVLGDIKEAKRYLIDEIDKFPGYTEDKRILNGRGIALFVEGKYKDALTYLEPLHTKEGLYYKAKCYSGLGAPLKAVSVYKELVNKYPGTRLSEYAFYSMGDALFENGDYTGAIKKYEDFLAEYPWTKLKHYARYKLGCSYLHESKYEKALENFYSVVNFKDPWLASHAYYQIANVLIKLGRVEEAITCYQHAKSDYPEMRVAALANIMYGQTYLLRQDTLGAQIAFQQMASIYPTGNFAGLGDYLAGTANFVQGRYIEAIEHYQRVLKLFPGSEVLIPSYAMMLFCYNQLGSYSDGVVTGASFYRILDNKEGIWVGRAKLFLAELYYYLGKYQQAQNLYDEVIKSYKALEGPAYIGKAWCILEEGRTDVAHAMLKEAYDRWGATDSSLAISSIYGWGIASFNGGNFEDAYTAFLFGVGELYPKSKLAGNAYYHGGKALASLGKYANTIQYWEKVLSDYPDCDNAPQAAFELARTYYLAGKYDNAINYYRIILNRYPDSPITREAQFQIGATYYTAHLFQDAIREFQKVVDLYPEDSLAVQAKNQIETSYYMWGQENPDALKQLIKLYPGSTVAADAQWQIAAQLYNDEKYEESIQEFQKLVVDFPESEKAAEAQYFIISIYGILGNSEKRIEECQKFLYYFPKDSKIADVYFQLGATYFNLTKYNEAIGAFEKIVNEYPNYKKYKDAGYYLGVCYKNIGEKDKGEKLIEKFKKE
ncbi:MAG: tetratricopeptide repeat protein [bacterium]|nr:tetratricopeptide repeat protein [bacterium]